MSDKATNTIRPTWRTFVAALLLVVTGVAAYSNSFDGVFLYDDLKSIRDNIHIRTLWPLSEAMSLPLWETGATVDGRPILSLSFAVNRALLGPDPWGFHAGNLLIHLTAGMLLFGIVRRTLQLALDSQRAEKGEYLAAAVALIWLAHPVHTQSVTYLAQRAESLMGMFYLATLYLAIRGFQSPPAKRSWGWFAGSVCCCALGVGTKEVIVSAPLIVLLYDYSFVSQSFRVAIVRRPAFYAGLGSTWFILAWLNLVRWGDVSSHFIERSPLQYALTQPGVILHYLQLSVWPDPLVVTYGWPTANGFSDVALPGVVITVLFGLSIWCVYRRSWLGFLGAWFFLILAPTSSFAAVQQNAQQHRIYLPLAAVVVLVFVTANYLLRKVESRMRKSLSIVMVAGITLTFIFMTFQRNKAFHDRETFWGDNVRQWPDSHVAQNNWGNILNARGESRKAIEHYRIAVKNNPRYVDAVYNWGNALLEVNDIDGGIQQFRAALAIDAQHVAAHYNLANQLMRREQIDEAIYHYQKALEVNSKLYYIHENLGLAYYVKGQHGQAMACYRRALELESKASIHTNWGSTLLAMGRIAEAAERYRHALLIDPQYSDAHNNLGLALYRMGEPEKAITHYQQALAINPSQLDAHKNLGLVFKEREQSELAIKHYLAAAELEPDNIETRFELAALYQRASRVDLAAEQLRYVLRQAEAAGNQDLAGQIRAVLGQLGFED